jgi:hypothetical protein
VDDGRSELAASRAQPDSLLTDIRIPRTAAVERGPEPKVSRPGEALDRAGDVVDG